VFITEISRALSLNKKEKKEWEIGLGLSMTKLIFSETSRLSSA
jgi:hypothetical protein